LWKLKEHRSALMGKKGVYDTRKKKHDHNETDIGCQPFCFTVFYCQEISKNAQFEKLKE